MKHKIKKKNEVDRGGGFTEDMMQENIPVGINVLFKKSYKTWCFDVSRDNHQVRLLILSELD